MFQDSSSFFEIALEECPLENNTDLYISTICILIVHNHHLIHNCKYMAYCFVDQIILLAFRKMQPSRNNNNFPKFVTKLLW
jgi:hypothetical protein